MFEAARLIEKQCRFHVNKQDQVPLNMQQPGSFLMPWISSDMLVVLFAVQTKES